MLFYELVPYFQLIKTNQHRYYFLLNNKKISCYLTVSKLKHILVETID